jgi:Ca2+-binding RTX toxin-like protein
MRGTLLLVSMTLALLLASGVALAEYGGGGGIEYNTVRCDGGKCEGTTNDDRMVGTDRRDILYAFKGSDLLFGNGSSDDLYGFLGYDQLRGGDGSDKLGGGEDRDDLYGNSGPDVLNGGDHADHMIGGDGNDKVFGGGGGTAGGYIENLDGGRGADLLSGGTGFEYYHFDPGWRNDTISDSDANAVIFHGSQKNLSVRLSAGAGPEATDGTNTVEWGDSIKIRLVGGSGDDTITGDDRSNDLAGSEGSDTINGGRGNDFLSSGISWSTGYGSYDYVSDFIDCGPGTDTAYFDPMRDTAINCENLNPE